MKRNAREIRNEEWIVVNERLGNMREHLIPVTVKEERKNELAEMMEYYVRQCEKARSICKRVDLPKILQTNVNEQKRERQDLGHEKANSTPKMAETSAPTPAIKRVNTSTSTMTMESVLKKGK